jgi:carbonic anhydrase
MAIATDAPFDKSHPDALAVYCSDGRFTAAVDELLEKLGHPRLDTLTIPGGPGLLNHKTSGYSDCDTFSRSAEFLIREHHITTVVLLAHEGCGFYARKFPDLSAEQIRKRQHDDLRLAMRELVETHPRLQTFAYIAVPSGDHVRFDVVDAQRGGVE